MAARHETPAHTAFLPAHAARSARARPGRTTRAAARLATAVAFAVPAVLGIVRPEGAAAQIGSCNRTSAAVTVAIVQNDGSATLAHARYDDGPNGCSAAIASDAHGAAGAGSLSTMDAGFCMPGPIIDIKNHVDCPVISHSFRTAARQAYLQAAGGTGQPRVGRNDAAPPPADAFAATRRTGR
jgi:hypothetical protein